ncbi:cation:proton antiporter [Candidatus Woesearchaeota archaeon]|nr:cation:proton antiporter [Candidatus Woesearchaeota archaeon]MBW3005421.1 cation:proton antiporter [Candidatus Woesearchaeota archaeon]
MLFEIEGPVLVLLFILFIGLIIPELAKKFKLPYITVLLLLGAVLGPNAFDYVQPNNIIDFFAFLGAAFLLLMAGMEAKLSQLKNLQKKIYVMSAANGLIPFGVGVAITRFFGYSWMASLLVGIVFLSSSFAIIIPILKSANLFKKQIGQTIASAVIIEDILSLLLLAIVLQTVAPITQFPLPVYFIILILSVVFLKIILPGFAKYLFRRWKDHDDEESQLRFVIVLLMAVLFYFSLLGVHPISAAFLVGILLADVVTSDELYNKLHTLAYGLFVPVFFFVVGMKMDLTIFTYIDFQEVIVFCLVAGLLLAKFLSGYFAARWDRFSKKNSLVFGISSTTQLTTTLAVTYAASALGLLDTTLVTGIVLISVITTVLSPLILNLLVQKKRVTSFLP